MILRTGLMAPMMFISSLVLIFSKSRFLALVTVLAIPLMLIIVGFINSKTRPLSKKQQKGLDMINLQIRESLTGLRIIRGFNNEEFKKAQFDEESYRYADISKKLFQTTAFISPSFTVIFGLVQVSVIYFGARQISQGLIEYGTLVAFIEYVFHALMSFLMLASVLMMYPRTAVAIQRIEEILDEEPNIKSKENGVKDRKIKGEIEFKNVSFAYSDSSEKSVLKNIDFKIEEGETAAFIGSTGSGKSTIIKLIPRLLDVSQGQILIDGLDLRDYDLDFLRSNIGYVPQKSTLYTGTIKENLQFGNRKASMDDIERAADIASAKEFIESSPEGYERILSEGGVNLSGGQQQRLCIARALTRDVPIYIFDDSFSALDYKTDSVLRKRLRSEVDGATKLIVAQRISTVMDADKIMVLNNGEVVGIGKHRDLLKSCEIYYQIASSQLTKEELEMKNKPFKGLLKFMGEYRAKFLISIFFSLVYTFARASQPFIIGLTISELSRNVMKAVSTGVLEVNFQYIGKMAVLLIVTGLIDTIGEYISNYLLAQAVQDTTKDIRSEIYNKLNHLPVVYFDSRQQGEILSRVTTDVTVVSEAMQQILLQVLSAMLSLVFSAAFMFYLSPFFALIGFIMFPVAFYVFKYFLKKTQQYLEIYRMCLET